MEYKAIFKPVNTSQGLDVRQFVINEKGLPSTYKWIRIEDKQELSSLPVLKPLIHCSSREEYNSQFTSFK